MGSCNGGSRGPDKTLASSPPAVGSGPAPTVVSPRYDAVGIDLCGRTDLDPLAGLSLVPRASEPQLPPSGPGAACLFTLRAPGGHAAGLRVEAATPATVEDAGRLYRATALVTSMEPAGRVVGLGDEAEAFVRWSDFGFRYAEYLVRARHANLVTKVWVAVGGDRFVPEQRLAVATMAITRATLALASRT
ncbi:hypothetical protein WEI85_05870 [Actinomycetes bacterium KLBMP 9797]